MAGHVPGATDSLTAESHFISLKPGVQLHMRRFYTQAEGIPVFLLHGSIENGRIFYSDSGKGLGPWLAHQGYDVFVADLRGRGKSTPRIDKDADYGQDEAIHEEIPAFVDAIHGLRGKVPMHWMAHSWGGVNLLSYLANPVVPVDVISLVFWGTKRRITVRNWAWLYMIKFGWEWLGKRVIRKKGFLDAIGSKMGADNISAKTYWETQEWILSKSWKHWKTAFDYQAALAEFKLPPILHLAGKKDKVLGNPKDVRYLMKQCGPHHDQTFHLLSKRDGFLHNYGHIDMLTHKDAVRDQFPIVLE
ncbi:MAG: alpha/beta fold hydrolase, partial [Bacteroidota bacterium]